MRVLTAKLGSLKSVWGYGPLTLLLLRLDPEYFLSAEYLLLLLVGEGSKMALIVTEKVDENTLIKAAAVAVVASTL